MTGCSMAHFAGSVDGERPYKVKVEGGCYESLPCQHFVTVVHDDGTKTRRRMSAPNIIALVQRYDRDDVFMTEGGSIEQHFRPDEEEEEEVDSPCPSTWSYAAVAADEDGMPHRRQKSCVVQ